MRKLTYKGIAKRLAELDSYATKTEREVVKYVLQHVTPSHSDFYGLCYNLQRLYEKTQERGNIGYNLNTVGRMMFEYYERTTYNIDILDSMKTHKLYSVVIT